MTKGDFHLSKITRNDGGLTVEYTTALENDGICTEVVNKVCDPREIHADLRDWFDRLAMVAYLVLKNPESLEIINEADAKALYMLDNEATPYISQVAFSQGAKGLVLILSGRLNTSFGAIKFKTPCLSSDSHKLKAVGGIIADAYAGLFDEVYAYLFEGKQAQLALFGDINKEANEEDDLFKDGDAED